jgi:lactate dehydrogenase-like 2-hydroxyacid dehydrogenase
MENKQLICDRLLECLYLTRHLYDLIDLDYIKEKEIVVAHFEGGGKKEINVAMDSGIAMIRDIIRAIGG